MPETPLDPSGTPPIALLDVDAELVDNLGTLVATEAQGMVLNLLADLHPADIARLLTHLPREHALQLIHWMDEQVSSEVLAELDPAYQAALLKELPPEQITAIVDELDTDDAADVLAELPDEVTEQILPALEDAADLQELLGYGEDTAGGLMAREYVSVEAAETIAEAVEEVRRKEADVVDLYVVYVVDEQNRLVGVVTLKRLLLAARHAQARVADVMDTDPIQVPTDLDQEEVARIMERYDLVSLPVVDPDGCLVGRITIDDVVDVLREEAEEDLQRMSGLTGDEEPTDSVLRITRGRLPWLLIGMVGAVLSGLVIGAFEDELERAVVLAFFIPVVMAMAGNAGIQSSAIVVQGLASGDVWGSDITTRLGKEMAVALINGVVLGLVLVGVVWLLVGIGFWGDEVDAPMQLALTSSLALLMVILLATGIGTTIPLLLHRVGIDPALATGPFITTSNDILGLAIFFLLAALLYLP
ncbi:MAG: magnesium transporter [Bacteroidota bacterium]